MRDAELLLPDFSLILIGYLLCRHTALDRPLWLAVEKLVYFFLFPVFLFQSIVRTPLDLHAASALLAAGLGLMTCGIALAWALPHLPGLRRAIDPLDHAASAQIAFRFNSFIGLAVAERALGTPGVQMMAVLIGVSVPLANLAAVWPMARHGERSFAFEIVRNPLIIATALGLAANLAGLGPPAWLQPTLSRIGASSIALGLLAAGAGMQLQSLARGKALGAGVLAIRHLLQPLAAWLLARAAPERATNHGPADLLGPAHLVERLRAGRAHGLQRRAGGGPGHAVHPARPAEPAVGTGLGGVR